MGWFSGITKWVNRNVKSIKRDLKKISIKNTLPIIQKIASHIPIVGPYINDGINLTKGLLAHKPKTGQRKAGNVGGNYNSGQSSNGIVSGNKATKNNSSIVPKLAGLFALLKMFGK